MRLRAVLGLLRQGWHAALSGAPWGAPWGAVVRPLALLCACALLTAAVGAAGLAAAQVGGGPADTVQADGPPPLVLQAARTGQSAWPALRVLPEPPGQWMRAPAAWAERHRFVVPQGPAANLGVQPGAVWLRMAVQVAEAGPADWVLDIDNPSLDELELHLVHRGRIVETLRSGDSVPMAQRPLPARSMALPLRLQPGESYDLLLRVRTAGTLLLPVSFFTPTAFAAREAQVQLVQGLLAGMGLCMLAYSMLHGAGSRDAMYPYYALTLTGSVMFFLAFRGLGTQHLWPDDPWLVDGAPLIFALMCLSARCLFADRALGMAAVWPRCSKVLRGMAVACAVVMAGFVLGAFSYGFVHQFATLISLLPMLVALPLAVHKARQGDAAARYLLAGWSVYGLGLLSMALLLRGHLPANTFTLHFFQLSAVFEMVMWMAVLSAHNDNMRRAGRAAEQERAKMATLALADPLTGLANRRGLRQSGGAIVAQAGPAQLTAVYMLDLDNFKPVNDEHGHDVGDKLLAAVAQRLRDVAHPSVCVARLGGDEFVVVAGGLAQAADAQALALALQAAVAEPFDVRGKVCQVGATVGYALAPQHGTELTQLLQKADAALYAGKRHGRGQVRVSRSAAELLADEEAAAWAARQVGNPPLPGPAPAASAVASAAPAAAQPLQGSAPASATAQGAAVPS